MLINQEQIFPSSSLGYFAVIGLAIICQVIGQGLVVYSLDKLSANFVALFLVLDPGFTTLKASVIFSEGLSFLSWIALFISLFGVYLTLFSKSMHQ